MSEQLEEMRRTSVVHPFTGELIDLDAPDEALADVIKDVQAFESELNVFKIEIGRELLRRMDRNACMTLHTEKWTIEGESKNRVKFVPEEIEAALRPFIGAEDGITVEAFRRAVKSKSVLYLDRNGLERMRKLGGRLAAAIKDCEHEIPDAARRIKSITPRQK